MRRKSFWIAASCILALAGLLPLFSSGESPASKEKVLYSFTGGSDGGQPLSDLTMDSAGNLYGTASQGGSAGHGVVFELKRTKDGWKEEVLHSFAGGKDGAGPAAGVIFDSAGNLYGTTVTGGNNNTGAVFELTPNSGGKWTERIIYSFPSDGSAGWVPQADLTFDAHGNLYGTASQGGNSTRFCAQDTCGTIFKLTPQVAGSWTETTIHAFAGPPDGGTPSSGLVLDLGNLYGMTQYGGTGSCFFADGGGNGPGCGTIYKLTPNADGSWTESVIYNFQQGGGFGKHPSGRLLFDSGGHLFGTVLDGGDGFGVVFELREAQRKVWHEDELHIFYGKPDGIKPTGGVVMDATGNLFGVTSWGGVTPCRTGCGVVFELKRSKDGWNERVFHTFSGGADGSNPQAGIVLGPQGQLYGTTSSGGTGCGAGCGTVYEVIPDRR